ncbi:MAG: glyoxalase [Alphaproteobacteria bacterium]|nr:MAG: glyoxalase [Alphaproteobacteria bacterium]
MAVKRVVPNIDTKDMEKAKAFYCDLLGMEIAMDMGWIVTLKGIDAQTPQISFMSEGGSGTPEPDLSIEVDDLDKTLATLQKAGVKIEYGPAEEPWGVRRFYVRDPFGRLLNILAHL